MQESGPPGSTFPTPALGSYWILRILLDILIDFNRISLCPIGFYLILILLDILIDFNGISPFPI